jgi:clan AA aspartic protease
LIRGQVNQRTEAIIPLLIRDSIGKRLSLDAVIDTGFSGYLTLPMPMITELQLPFLSSRTFSLGDNSEANFDIYKAVLVWDRSDVDVKVLASEAHPLIGMSLLKGFVLTIDVVDGGDVRIVARP